MPIYEYECVKCGHQTEAWQKFSDPPLEKCDLCGGKMRKLISQSSFHLKGGGWYVTEYGSRSTGTSAGAKKEEKKETATATEKAAKASTEKS